MGTLIDPSQMTRGLEGLDGLIQGIRRRSLDRLAWQKLRASRRHLDKLNPMPVAIAELAETSAVWACASSELARTSKGWEKT
jgi:hypothetical protein